MPSKRELLLDSIRELLSLQVPDEEIIMNLKEVDIAREEARMMILEAKNPKMQETVKQKLAVGKFGKLPSGETPPAGGKAATISAERKAVTEELASESADEIAEDISGDEEAKSKRYRKSLESLLAEVKKPLPSEKEAHEEKPVSDAGKKPARSAKGKPGKAAAKPKAPAVEEEPAVAPKDSSAEDLKVSKLWEKGILAAVNNSLTEMRKIRDEAEETVDKKVEAAFKKESEKLQVLLDSQRSLTLSKVDTEIASKAQGFVDLIEMKLREMREIGESVDMQMKELKESERKSSAEEGTLELKMQNLDEMKEQLIASLNSEIIKSKTQIKQLTGQMESKLVDMDDRINKTLQLEEQIVEGLRGNAEQKVAAMIEEKSKEIGSETEQRIDAKLAEMQSLHDKISKDFRPEALRLQVKEIEEYKAQMADSMEKNVKRFSKIIKELQKQKAGFEKDFAERTERIDKKITEFEAFEKSFSRVVDLTLKKLSKAK